jgi:hypothetical protein
VDADAITGGISHVGCGCWFLGARCQLLSLGSMAVVLGIVVFVVIRG